MKTPFHTLRRHFLGLLGLAGLTLLIPGQALAQDDAPGLHAGTASVDITPKEWPLHTRGSFNPRTTDTAHDPLHARALALRNGDGRAVIVIVDNLLVPREVLDPIKERAAEATGWKPSEMLIAATHTHSAPTAAGSATPQEVAYGKLFADNVVKAITDAVGSLQPASVGWGAEDLAEEVFNRRWYLEEGAMPANPFGGIDQVKMNPGRTGLKKPAGPVDPTISVVDVRTRKGRPLGFLANYSLHYVGGVPGGQVSADYFGEFSRLIGSRLAGSNVPEDFVGMMSNGASGDINNSDFTGKRPPREPFEQIRIVASKAADTAWRATRGMEYHEDVPVRILQREVELKWRKPSEDEVKRAKEILSMTEEEQKKLPRLAPNYAERTLKQASDPETIQAIVQAVRIGELAIVTMPFEVLVEIGLDIRERSPFSQTFMIELANGTYGYLPPPHQYDLGGYETWLGTNRVERNSSVLLTDNLLEMLEELKK